ncbi:hypothetical protein DFH28DRAFT_1116982 [Melampsora americana]|nr:hypothetical protein DFH28DRAFT_1116982 [Melampsora americana]
MACFLMLNFLLVFDVPENVITCAWDPAKLNHEGHGSEPRFRKDEAVRLHFQTTLQNSIENAITALRDQRDLTTPNRHLQLENGLRVIQQVIAQDWKPEEEQVIDEGSSSTQIQKQAVLSTTDQTKENAQKEIKLDHQAASEDGPLIVRLPPLSQLLKKLELTSPSEPKSPAETALGIEKSRSTIHQESDPRPSDLIVNFDPRIKLTRPTEQIKMKEMIQILAQKIKSPTRSRLDTPHSRAIRAASWDALLYLAYFDSRAESELIELYERVENTAFLSAHVLNLYKRFLPSDFNTKPLEKIPLQKILSRLEVPKEHIQYADFFQFHDRFLKVHPIAQERFERISQDLISQI